MSFMVFQLLFAVVVVGLLVVAVLIVRQIRHKGAAKPPREAAAKAPRPRKPGLGRKAPEPEPEEPAPARRRQLQSFAEAERSAAEAEAVVLPVPAAPVDTAADAAVEAEPEPVTEAHWAPEADEPATELDAEKMTDEALDYSEAVLGRLEEAFEDLQAGDITLAAYRERIQAEQAAVEARIAALQPAGDSAELDAALAARESVLWCIDWAAEQASAE